MFYYCVTITHRKRYLRVVRLEVHFHIRLRIGAGAVFHTRLYHYIPHCSCVCVSLHKASTHELMCFYCDHALISHLLCSPRQLCVDIARRVKVLYRRPASMPYLLRNESSLRSTLGLGRLLAGDVPPAVDLSQHPSAALSARGVDKPTGLRTLRGVITDFCLNGLWEGESDSHWNFLSTFQLL